MHTRQKFHYPQAPCTDVTLENSLLEIDYRIVEEELVYISNDCLKWLQFDFDHRLMCFFFYSATDSVPCFVYTPFLGAFTHIPLNTLKIKAKIVDSKFPFVFTYSQRAVFHHTTVLLITSLAKDWKHRPMTLRRR